MGNAAHDKGVLQILDLPEPSPSWVGPSFWATPDHTGVSGSVGEVNEDGGVWLLKLHRDHELQSARNVIERDVENLHGGGAK